MQMPDFETLLQTQAKPKGLLKTKKEPENVKEAITHKDLKDLDLEHELLKQYQRAQELLEFSDDEPLNQRAQTLNSITSILQAIIKLQQDLYNMERLKTLENTLVNTLQEFPQLKEKFLDSYRKNLKV